MTENQIAEDVIYLSACAVNERVPDEARIRAMDPEKVYNFAACHMVSSAVAFSLESAGHRDKRSGKAISSAMHRTAVFEREWEAVRAELEEAGIWYMPLKGAILKDTYPKYGMREFADYDVLFDAGRADDVRVLMEKLGFRTVRFGAGDHDCYCKEPVLNFEMHRRLFGPARGQSLYEYYSDVKNRLLGSGYGKQFTPEDFYVFMIAHEYKHYTNRGTGLRSLLDTYVYLRNSSLDMDYAEAEIQKLGIADFEKENRTLAMRLFDGRPLTDAGREMLDYVLSSGTYGTFDRQIENNIRKNGSGKIRYMIRRFSVPMSRKNEKYEVYAGFYPLFYKHRILLPVLPFYRTFMYIRKGRFGAEVKAVMKAKK